jgi:aminomethyltransferase
VTLELADDRALLALQGPAAATVIARHTPEAANLAFMSAAPAQFDGIACHISRSGYTGEDGFEISLKADKVEFVARALLAAPEVKPIGLGARDSLRLEAGLCLYGHDIDEATSPIEADLGFAVAKRRAEGGYPGADRVAIELRDGPSRKRIGLKLDGRTPAREGAEILDPAGKTVGGVTSGGFAPTVGSPVAMGYVEAALCAPGTAIAVNVRGKALPATVTLLPFVPHRYFRKPAS